MTTTFCPGKYERTDVRRDKVPDACPMCHRSVAVEETGWALCPDYERQEYYLQCVFRCPYAECRSFFIGYYERIQHPPSNRKYGGGMIAGEYEYCLGRVAPMKPRPLSYPSEIQTLSSGFIQCVTQSAAAEAYGLDQVAGTGYRKALEFLIKDFCIAEEPSHAALIRRTPLGSCINDHVNDANIKLCATRANWLGTDEGHYEKRYTDNDIEDLKVLIELTVIWIRSHLLTKKYAAEITNMSHPESWADNSVPNSG